MTWSDDRLERREFLRRMGLVGAGALLAPPLIQGWASEAAPAKSVTTVPRRRFGRHDVMVSSLALGGHSLRKASDEEAARMVDAALELGVDFFDNAWDYHNGTAEEQMGRLIEGRRDKVFLMTKVCTHDEGNYDDAMRMLDESLKRLRTDYLDLWQWHAVAKMEQVEKGFAKDGVVRALTAAKESGRVKYVGFTGHTDPDVHLAVLEHDYPFDACQIPISAIEANSNAFVRRVLPEILRQKIAPLAMKTLGGNYKAINDGILTREQALQYAWSYPVATLVTGVETESQLRENVRTAIAFQPMSPEQMVALEDSVKPATESEKYQPYRRWMSYRDGDADLYAGIC